MTYARRCFWTFCVVFFLFLFCLCALELDALGAVGALFFAVGAAVALACDEGEAAS